MPMTTATLVPLEEYLHTTYHPDAVDDFLLMGVKTLWMIDPRRRKAQLIDATGQRPVDVLTLAGYDLQIPLAEVFAELDELGDEAR